MYSLIEMKEPSLYITLLNEILIKQLKVWKKFKVHRQKYAAFQQQKTGRTIMNSMETYMRSLGSV